MRSKSFYTLLIIVAILVPVFSFADAERIFMQNRKTVVIVATFDENGNPLGQGSGFIVRADGAVVTNYHVLHEAKRINVKVGSKILEVQGLINADKENDLVILKVKGDGLPVVKLGDIEKVSTGQKIYSISSPKGLENTISDGILSGIREIEPGKKVLQITAPISPGSSGGPVFNENGEVIGITTFLIKEAQNLNFAMPVNLISGHINNKKVTALKDLQIEESENTVLSRSLRLQDNNWLRIIDKFLLKETPEEFHKQILNLAKVAKDEKTIELLGKTIKEETEQGKVYRTLAVEIQFLKPCKATVPDRENDEFSELKTGDDIKAPELYEPLYFKCNYRLKVFATFYSKNGVELETKDTLLSAKYVNNILKDMVVPGERMWISFFIPDNAESWKVWVPK